MTVRWRAPWTTSSTPAAPLPPAAPSPAAGPTMWTQVRVKTPPTGLMHKTTELPLPLPLPPPPSPAFFLHFLFIVYCSLLPLLCYLLKACTLSLVHKGTQTRTHTYTHTRMTQPGMGCSNQVLVSHLFLLEVITIWPLGLLCPVMAHHPVLS